jgi:hypothetical protein
MLDPDHADAYFNMALMHQEQALDESCTGLTFLLLPPSPFSSDIDRKRSELAKALRCYRAVVDLSSKIDPALVEESHRGIYQIEALQASHS